MPLKPLYAVLIAGMLLAAGGETGRAAPDTATPRYRLTDLGVTPFIADNTSLSIDNSGAVGLWRTGASSAAQAALWRDGETTILPPPAGYLSSVSRSLSGGGAVIAGWTSTSGNSVDSLATTRAFVARGGKLTVLKTLGGRDSQAFGVNAAGLVVGASQTKARERRAFVLRSGTVRDLGVLPTGRASAAYAVNDAGVIVGAADLPLAGTKIFMNHAVMWREGKIADLGLLPDGKWAIATAINRKGEIVGMAGVHADTHAFLYRDGHLTDLGSPGEDPVSARAIGDGGEIVGTFAISERIHHAFLWKNGAILDLNKCLPKELGWTLLQGDGVNARGQIVCQARGAGGEIHAVMLTPVSE